MFEPELAKKLKDIFGTDKPGNCSNCSYKDVTAGATNTVHSRLRCGQRKCPILTKYEMLKAESINASGITNPEVKALLARLAKTGLLGYREIVAAPWILVKSDDNTSCGWVNPQKKVYSKKMYKKIFFKGSMLVCLTDETAISEGHAEIFSIGCGDINLADGIPELKYTQERFKDHREQDGYVICHATDTASEKRMGIVISKYGDRLVIPYDPITSISIINDDLIIRFPGCDHINSVVRTDRRLNVLRSGKGMIAVKI